MTCSLGTRRSESNETLHGEAASHSAELVRGYYVTRRPPHPPFGHLLPRGRRAPQCGPLHYRTSAPLALRQASMPPWIWHAEAMPASWAACTAMAERSPKAQ